jgi:DNA replication protein DnaC
MISKVLENVDFSTLGKSDEWWAKRDAEVAEHRAQEATRAEAHRLTERAGELRDNGFPELFITAALGQLRDTPAMTWAQRFVSYLPKRMIILAGGVGAGKTTAAAWIALKGQDPRPGFLRVGELERRGRYDKKLDEWLRDKTSLVIDDVGTEVLDGKGVFVSLFGEVLDGFYANRRTIVMTTNLHKEKKDKDDQPQFLERYGERVWSRLHQSGMWGACGGLDLRREQQP